MKKIHKVKVGLIASAIVIIILVISGVLVYANLQNRINALEMDNTSLQGQVNNLETAKNNLQSQIDSLQIEKDTLQSQLSSVEMKINQLQTWLDGNKTLLQTAINKRNQLQIWLDGNITNYESQLTAKDSQIQNLNSEIGSLNAEITTLQNKIDSLNLLISEYDEAMFFFYYVVPEQKFGVYDLEDDLYGLEWLYPYEGDVFDCSEMSAYLEWYLEGEGWNTLIIVGDAPFGGGYHAWLLVETSEGHYMPVESTTIEIVWWEDPYFDNYFIYDYTFETILDAVAYSETEFDWWK